MPHLPNYVWAAIAIGVLVIAYLTYSANVGF